MAAISKVSSRSPGASYSSAGNSSWSQADVLVAAYERYVRLIDLAKLWSSRDFSQWKNESVLKPAIQALEISFRLISIALSDPRPYANHQEWIRRLESLTSAEIEIIGCLCEEDDGNGAPIVDLRSRSGVLGTDQSSHEVWHLPDGAGAVVSHASVESLLPRLATWEMSKGIAGKIQLQIESRMQGSPFTLGLGEPNLAGKPIFEYDLAVRPSDLHFLKKTHFEDLNNQENQKLFTIHQIFESWLASARELVKRMMDRLDSSQWGASASDCWLLERVWKLLADITDLHLLMDPDDLLHLKSQLGLNTNTGSDAFCFRSAALREFTTSSGKELKRRVPWVLGVEADPSGGPRLQEAAMRLFHCRRRGEDANLGRIQLLQAFQAVEAGVKRFYFGYMQVVTAAMGSLEVTPCRNLTSSPDSGDSMTMMFSEPPYFPSLDAAKTFLGELWQSSEKSDGRCGPR